ncbi:MAG: Crp/Fnr family transcriptional regulator [Bacteroidetes bacterium]|nr:Crp/Fnr family transcriptional regulator [Bacteroidota bacterium]
MVANKIKKSHINVNADCSTCVSLGCSVLRNCSPECLQEVSAAKRCFVYVKGQRILMEGIESDGVYFINTGKVKIFKSDKDDKQLILRFAKSGEILGFCSIDERKEQPVSAVALDDTVICYLDNKDFMRIIRDNPELALGLLKFYNEELIEVENKSLKLARMNVPGKVADALMTMYDAYGSNGKNCTLNLMLSRQDIANLAGTTKEQVSKALSEFKLKGIVKTKGKQIDILNLNSLRSIAEI